MKIMRRADDTELKLPSISELVASGVSIKDAQYKHYRAVLRAIYSPIAFQNCSYAVNDLVKQYKDKPLLPYKMTDADRKKLENNPDYINDIPRYYVPEYDKAVSNIKFDTIVAKEFYNRFMNNDRSLISICDIWNEEYYLIAD